MGRFSKRIPRQQESLNTALPALLYKGRHFSVTLEEAAFDVCT
jgi:hypothetical protein